MGIWKVFFIVIANNECINLNVPIKTNRLTLNPIVIRILCRIFLDLKRTVHAARGACGYATEMIGVVAY